MLTRKHFQATADCIKQAHGRDDHTIALQIALNLCTVFKAETPSFDRERFLAACSFDKRVK